MILLPVSLILFWALVVYILIDCICKRTHAFLRRLVRYSFLIYLMAVAHVTIGSLHIPPDSLGYVRVQLIPFYFVKDFMTVQQMGNWFLLNALKLSFYNVLLLMPLGFYLGFLFEVKRKASAILLVFLTSLLIETVQWILSAAGVIWSRTFNVDDLLLNTIGGLIGYVVFKIVQKVSSRKKVRKISNNERISGLNSSL